MIYIFCNYFVVTCKKEKCESKDKANPMSISVPNLTCTANSAPLEQGKFPTINYFNIILLNHRIAVR